jgi:hypothetical protein
VGFNCWVVLLGATVNITNWRRYKPVPQSSVRESCVLVGLCSTLCNVCHGFKTYHAKKNGLFPTILEIL